jgi:Family of unknown function (DUF6459)
MEQNSHPQLPWHAPELPVRPAVVPMLPTRLRQPGSPAPLPDSVAVRQLAVPDPAPPYDDELPAGGLAAADPTGQDHDGNAAGDAAAAARRLGPDSGPEQPDHQPGGPDAGSGPGPCDPPGGPRQPDPAGRWPSQFAQVLAETLAGSRPAQQLTPWTTEQARSRIRQLGPMLATDQRPRVRRVMTSAPAAGVLEMTAVVGFGPRVRVLALRLERGQARPYRRDGGRWRCTAIESA